MKKLLLIVFLVSTINNINAQSIGIGTNTPNNSAMLDINSTSKGMLAPRMTSAQRTAIVSPANGLMVYDITTNSFWFYNGSGWINLSVSNNSSGGEALTFPYDTTLALPGTAFRIINTGSGIQGGSINGFGVLATSTSSAGLSASSANSYGIISTSTNKSAIYAYNSNTYAAIDASNSYASGIGIRSEVTGASGRAIYGGATNNGTGVEGWNGGSGIGVKAVGANGYALYATSSGPNAITAKFEQPSLSGKALEVNGNLEISGGNTSPGAGKVLTSDASGNATWQTPGIKVGFKLHDAYPGGANVFAENTWYKVYFEDESYDYDNNILPGITSTSSAFTAPVAGLYHFDAAVQFGRYGIDARLRFVKVATNGAETTIAQFDPAETQLRHPAVVGGGASMGISADAKLAVGEKVILKAFWSNGYQSGSSYTHVSILNVDQNLGMPMANYFSGHLVFAN